MKHRIKQSTLDGLTIQFVLLLIERISTEEQRQALHAVIESSLANQ